MTPADFLPGNQIFRENPRPDSTVRIRGRWHKRHLGQRRHAAGWGKVGRHLPFRKARSQIIGRIMRPPPEPAAPASPPTPAKPSQKRFHASVIHWRDLGERYYVLIGRACVTGRSEGRIGKLVETFPNGVQDMVKSAAIGVVSLLLSSALAFAYVNPDGSITPSITDSYLWINFAILGLPAIWIPIVYG
ncbi:MAG: hypothetical protein HC900_11490 [Methylacidiphilales bacterium]|nr:hypothetical protein [Candidatus Methylacidiphilales bacterium]